MTCNPCCPDPVPGPGGPTGPAGPQGVQGLQGIQGIQGLRGYPGPKGADGVSVPLAPLPTGGDDTALIANYIESNAGDVVTLRSGETYIVTGTIPVPTKTVLELNDAIIDCRTMADATALGQRIAFTSTGSIGPDLAVSVAISQYTKVITGISSTITLLAGDLILLSNDEAPVPGMTRTDRDKGELVVIASVDSATQITIASETLFAYGTTGLTIQKITPVEDVVIRNGTILMGGVNSGHNAVQVRYGKNISINNLRIDGAEDISVSMNTVYQGRVEDCSISNATSSPTLGTTGYGVAVVEGSRHVNVARNKFYNCRHFVAGGGYWPAAFVEVSHNTGEVSSNAAYDCHEPCFYWNFNNNTAVGVANGFAIRGQHITVESNEVFDSAGRAIRVTTFDGATEQRGIRIIGNRAVNTVYGIEVDGQAAGAEPNCLKINTEIVGNKLLSAGSNPILLRHFDGAMIKDNFVEGSTSHAVLCLGLVATQSLNLTGGGNIIRTAGADGFKAQYIDNLGIVGGEIVAPVTNGLEILNSNNVDVSTVVVRSPGQNGAFLNVVTKAMLSNIHISGGVGVTYDAARVTGSDDISFNGGYYASARNAIYTTTTDHVIVQGVNARGATSGTKINVDAATQAVGNNLS